MSYKLKHFIFCILTEASDAVAAILYDKVRVLCWVMTSPANHDAKAKHVKATWGKRCNILGNFKTVVHYF